MLFQGFRRFCWVWDAKLLGFRALGADGLRAVKLLQGLYHGFEKD